MHDGGDEQGRDIRRISDQEYRDPDIEQEPGSDESLRGEFYADDLADRYCDQGLHGAQEHLIDQVRDHIG